MGLDNELWRAAGAGEQERVSELLEHGAQVDSVNEDGVTSLMRAAAAGAATVVATLLVAGANVHAKDKSGWTPVLYCAQLARDNVLPTLERLLSAGADPRDRLQRPGAGFFNAGMILDQRNFEEGGLEGAVRAVDEAGCDRPPGWRPRYSLLARR